MDICIRINKYHKIIEKARVLFWKHGLSRVTIDEICREAEVSKMTFYKQFRNKKQLAQVVFEDVLKKSKKQYQNIMQQDIPFTQKVKQVIVLKHESTNMISEEFLKDVYQHKDLGLKKIMTAYKKSVMDDVMRDMIEAQKQGDIRNDLRPEFILYMLNDMSAKLMDKNLAANYNNSQELIMELTKFFFYGIMETRK